MQKDNLDEILSAISSDFNKLIDELNNDINIIEEYLQKHDNQTSRRLYIRTAISIIEGMLSYMKASINASRKFDHTPLTAEESKILNEHYKFIDKNGKIKQRYFRLSFLDNVIFTLELFAYSNYVFTKIDTKDHGWSSLKNLVAIRNRITHPKESRDLLISDNDIINAKGGYNWFIDNFLKLHYECYSSLIEQAEGMEKAAMKKGWNIR
jgi:hypothetical protein